MKRVAKYLDELSFRMVLALPNASKIGFASKICCSIHECFPLMAAKYCNINFVLSLKSKSIKFLFQCANDHMTKDFNRKCGFTHVFPENVEKRTLIKYNG